jgi:hypothetical protein
LSPTGALILGISLAITVAAPRKWALWGTMLGIIFVTQAQNVQIGGFNLYGLRILELAGFIRVMARREFSFSQINKMDKVVILLYVYSTVIYLIRSKEGQANQIGMALDAMLCYFMFRGLIHNFEDYKAFLRNLVILLLPFAGLVLMESLTGHNVFFSLMGTGDVVEADWSRGGRLRCYGSFRHPSLLGTLGASFLPLYVGLACIRSYRKVAFFAIGLCMIIVWASNSGGPANCAAVGLVGWMLWPMRRKMKLLRRLLAIFLALVALTMKAPIWYLPARASAITGGDGWHRSYLMDVAFSNFGKWWAVGLDIKGTEGWFPYDLGTTGGADITNQFLSFALTGGLLAMLLFIYMIVHGFGALGRALAARRAEGGPTQEAEFLMWGLGAMLAAHIFNWLGITYFDQTYALWFFQLAAISTLSYLPRDENLYETALDDHPEFLDGHEDDDRPITVEIDDDHISSGAAGETPPIQA